MKTKSQYQKTHSSAHRCTADRLATRKAPPATMEPSWSLYVGLIKLAIIGPEDHQWFSVSKPCYQGVVGTERERDIARRAVRILNREYSGNSTIGRATIDDILARANAERAAENLPTE